MRADRRATILNERRRPLYSPEGLECLKQGSHTETSVRRESTSPGNDLGFRIEAVIGRGGMGTVHLATQMRLGRRVALKMLLPEFAADDEYRARLLRESELAASRDLH
jgi:serine/threonine protein kinase